MQKILIRKAIVEDKIVVWEWWNDSLTRKMMKLNEYVPFENHTVWFDNTICSNTRILLMAIVDNHKIGVVRFDFKEENVYEISINLNPDYRSQGYGKSILKASIEFFLNINPETKKFFAMFKKINIASKKTFLNNGFILIQNVDTSLLGLERFDSNVEEYCEMINIRKMEN